MNHPQTTPEEGKLYSRKRAEATTRVPLKRNCVAECNSQTGRVLLDDNTLALARAQLMELVASRPQTGDAALQPCQPVAHILPNAVFIRTLRRLPGNALQAVLEGLAGRGETGGGQVVTQEVKAGGAASTSRETE